MKDDITCALSGVLPNDEEEDNELGGIPEGWIEITVKRVFPNSKYIILQQLKQQAVQMTLAQVPEEQRAMALESVQTQVDATYYAFESSLKDYVEETDTVYIAPPENDDAILKEYTKLAELLGFDPMLFEDDDQGEEDEEESASKEPQEEVEATENEK